MDCIEIAGENTNLRTLYIYRFDNGIMAAPSFLVI
jgi:hypothetical protein